MSVQSKADASFGAAGLKAVLVVSACLLAVLVALLLPAGGHFMVDEGAYHMMLRDFAGFRDFALWNGYEEFPSGELSFPVLRDHDGRLVSQYPEIYTLLALPFYHFLGYDGLFLLSALAFTGLVGLTYWMARYLFASPRLALNACLILVLASYAWEYSQATLPHVLGAFFVAATVSLTLPALLWPDERRAYLLAFASGFVAALGAGVRFDVFFVMPALTVPYLFLRPWRPWHALLCGLGALPGLALLTVLNQAKFGIASPFSYGSGQPSEVSGISAYLAVAGAGVLAVAAARLAATPWGSRKIRRHPLATLLGLALACGAVLAIPEGWTLASRLGDGLYQLLVDLRIRDLSLLEGGLSRGPDGAMVYLGAVKKSLLQSCPYLVVLLLPLVHLASREQDRVALGVLLLVPVSQIGALAYFAAHGGPGLNLRYLVISLPFTSILAAYTWREVAGGLSDPWRRALPFAGAVLATVYAFFVLPYTFELERQAFFFLNLPLGLACGLLLLTLLFLRGGEASRRALRGPMAVAMVLGFVWAGLVAYSFDLPRSYILRKDRAELSREVAPLIAPDSLLIAYSVGSFFGLLEHGRVRLATPPFDGFRDFEALVRFHLEAGRPVYLWVTEAWTRALERYDVSVRLSSAPLWEQEHGRLVRITGID
jgi:hypothetical protein